MELKLVDDAPARTHVRLEGRMDAAAAEAIGLRFTTTVAAQARPALVDLGGVDFVASMGMRLLVSTARALKAKGLPLVFYGLQAEVREVMEDAGMTQLLTVADDLTDAEQRLAG